MRGLALLVALAASAAAARAHACPGCSNPNLPVGGNEAAAPAPGRLDVRLAAVGTRLEVVHEEACPEIGPICERRDEPPQLHDQALTMGELRAILSYGLTRRLSLEAQVPVRLVDTAIVYRRLDGEQFFPDYENIHHRDETIAGIGDVQLLGRAGFAPEPVWLGVSVGVSLPLGRTEEDPFTLADAGRAHQHVQLGTGTFNPLVRLEAGLPAGPTRLAGYGQAELVLYENEHGFRAGNRYALGASAAAPPLWGVTFSGLADALSERPERWDGEVHAEGNLGRNDVLVGARASLVLGGVTLALGVRVPVYTHALSGEADGRTDAGHDHGAEEQIDYPLLVDLSVGWSHFD